LGHPSRLKIGTLARPLPAFNCSEEVFAMDILAESKFTFRQGHTVQPFAMVSGNDEEMFLIIALSQLSVQQLVAVHENDNSKLRRGHLCILMQSTELAHELFHRRLDDETFPSLDGAIHRTRQLYQTGCIPTIENVLTDMLGFQRFHRSNSLSLLEGMQPHPIAGGSG